MNSSEQELPLSLQAVLRVSWLQLFFLPYPHVLYNQIPCLLPAKAAIPESFPEEMFQDVFQ